MPRCLWPIFTPILLMVATGVWAAPGALEDEVLDEINFARTQPYEYAQELRRYRDLFDGKFVDDVETGGHMTYEGTRPVDEAIRFLEAQRPLAPLSRGAILERAAADHAAEQGARGGRGHISAGGLTAGRRVARRGGGVYVSETISYGFSAATAVVRGLIVDDGVPGRGHRAVMFFPYLRYAGVGCGRHAAYGHMCVIDYSQTSNGLPVMPAGLSEDRPKERHGASLR